MNNVINSITDYKPEDTFLLPAQFDIIKDQVEDVPFSIDNDEIARQLIYAEMIKREEVRIPKEEYESDPESYPFDNMRRTGKYLLSPKGIRKVAYENQKAKESRIMTDLCNFVQMFMTFWSIFEPTVMPYITLALKEMWCCLLHIDVEDSYTNSFLNITSVVLLYHFLNIVPTNNRRGTLKYGCHIYNFRFELNLRQ